MSTQPHSIVTPRTELTVRGLILGVVITLVFTAANVFFGLKAGLTFATSIPAAVIYMAILRRFRNTTMSGKIWPLAVVGDRVLRLPPSGSAASSSS